MDVQAAQAAYAATDRASSEVKTEQQRTPTAVGDNASSQQPQPRQSVSGVRSTLFPHQLAGVQWMARRETGQSAEGTSPLGGIVADQAGLGKTLMMLALVAQAKKQHEQRQQSPQPQSQRQPAPTSQQRPSCSEPAFSARLIDVDTVSSRCTLVVCPRAVLRQWQRECSVHLEAGLLSVDCLVSGSSRTALTAHDIARCDVLITSYETVRSQHQRLLTSQQQAAARLHQPLVVSSPPTSAAASDVSSVASLFSVSYLRLIADEAHRLRNRKAQVTAAVCALSAVHRWYVTATPLQNSIDDLYPAFVFLRYAPYSEYRVWKQYMHTKDGKGVERCRTLLRAVAIRRRKAHQQLLQPPQQHAPHGLDVQGGVELTAKHIQMIQLTFSQKSTRTHTCYQTEARNAVAVAYLT